MWFQMWNVEADNWHNGRYCLGSNVPTKAQAEWWARKYTEKYEGKPFPNGKGWYQCKNFRAVRVWE